MCAFICISYIYVGLYVYIQLFFHSRKELWSGHVTWSKLLSIYFVPKLWNNFSFSLLGIFPAIWICQFTASLHVYNTAFLQQLSLSHNAIVHLVCWVVGHNMIENSLHVMKKRPSLDIHLDAGRGLREGRESTSTVSTVPALCQGC